MQGHRIGFVLGLAVAAASLALAACDTAVTRAGSCWRTARRWAIAAFDWVVSRIKVEDVQNPAAPRRALIGAAQFLGRMVRRDRPLMTPRWRMCPSI